MSDRVSVALDAWEAGMALKTWTFGLLSLAVLAGVPANAQTVEKPERGVEDPGVITTRQAITPAGVQSVFKGRVHAAAFGEPGELYVLSRTTLYRMNWLENRVIGRQDMAGASGIRGLVYDAGAKRAIATTAATVPGKPADVRLLALGEAGPATLAEGLGTHIAGAPALIEGAALVPLTYENALAVTPLSGGAARRIAVGVAPVAVAAADGIAYVANWGGTEAVEGALSAPTGLAETADKVAIDPRGVALGGTISVVDLASGTVRATIPVGRHPTALAIDAAGKRLYVANANDDTISVIDTARSRVIRTLTIQPFAAKTDGVAPTGLAFDAARKRLYIACGGINAVAVYDLAANRIAGLIPTSWYPVSVALSPDGANLAVAALLGVGSGQNDGPSKRFVHANRGAAHVIPVPDDAQLASYSAAVAENNRVASAPTAAVRPNRRAKPLPVPLRAGEPSPIEHVVYIIKENRTYDQVFGDLERGNGEPSFVMYGEDVTPNTRRLARDFVLLDNFYATGGNSANGHQWVTQANEASYTLWPGYAGRSYPFDGTDPLAYAKGGFLWDLARAAGKTSAVFGEFAPRLSWGDENRAEHLAEFTSGAAPVIRWKPTTSPIPGLDPLLARDFPGYSMGVPDVTRAQIFLQHLARYEASGSMPNLTIIQLPCDHTSGTRPGVSTPKAMVADNDLALGMIVETLTKTKFWSKMAIFVVEDDAQNGVDHVDGHRTVALVVSPYARRGAVDSTFYAQQSMVKTIELMLGLPTMSLFDLIATDMRASFQEKPNFQGYTALKPRQDLLERNPEVAKLAGDQRAGALASAAMRFDVPDAVPSAVLNKILWHDAKGWSTAYPAARAAVFSPYRTEDEEEGEADEGADLDLGVIE